VRLTHAQLRKALGQLLAGDWQAAHEIVQRDEESALACWAHGIVHIMEGDLPNARYWYRQAARSFPSKPDAAAEVRALKAELGA
jgi:Tfp pilus assembly protein PilF